MVRRAVGLLIGSIVVLTLPESVSAHGGGPESAVSFGAIVNWLHFVATALWLGGITCLRFAILPSLGGSDPQGRKLSNAINFRFAHLVWWCIGGLALTGVLTTWVHVPSVDAVNGTAYGLILAIKLAIAAGMIACNAIISIVLARRWRSSRRANHVAAQTVEGSAARWMGLASRLSLPLAFLMMVSIAALVEFDRSIWSIMLNFLRLSALTVWFGSVAFFPLVVSPSLAGVDRAYLVRANAAILRRFGKLVTGCAAVALATTALTLLKSLDSLSDLWETGYGIASLLELAVLVAMAAVLWRSGLRAGPSALRPSRKEPIASLATSKTMSRAIDISGANLVLGLGALLFSSLGGALYSPGESTLASQIPTAAWVLSLDWIEPLGYVMAAVVAVAMIWYFGVVEGKVSKRDADEAQCKPSPTSGQE